MPYIIVDLETTGLVNFKLPADDPSQPRIASASFILVDDELEIESEHEIFVKPDGWVMSAEAMKVTGITMEKLEAEGRPILEVMKIYADAIDAGRISVAHNHQFDGKCLRSEFRRAGLDDRFEKSANICTMRGMTDICKIPPVGGRGSYKWPALSEALLFIGAENLGDHSAINDAKGALELLRYMKRNNVMPEARVHYAKDRD